MHRSWLRWVAPAALVAAGALGVAMLVGGDGGAPSSTATSLDPSSSGLRAAVEQAGVEVTGVTDVDVEELVLELCTSRDATRLANRVVDLGVTEPADVRALVEGVGRGAAQHCPAVPAEQPELVNEAYTAVLSMLRDDTG